MTLTSSVIGIVPGLQATAVMGRSLSMVPKKIGKGKPNGKKMLRGFTDIMIGTALIKPTANIAAGL